MYYAAVFWRLLMYTSIAKNPAFSLAVAANIYIQFLSGFLCRSHTISRISTWE